MAVINKRSRKDPVEAPKKRGRPAGTRAKHVPTIESVRAEWEKRYVDLQQRSEVDYENLMCVLRRYEKYIRDSEHDNLEKNAIISYLENKIEQLIANSVRGN